MLEHKTGIGLGIGIAIGIGCDPDSDADSEIITNISINLFANLSDYSSFPLRHEQGLL
jgi:hypothetical protein